jgi:hypothetical protein
MTRYLCFASNCHLSKVIMRLPGCFHISYNQGNPIYSPTKIISASSHYYSYHDLRLALPVRGAQSSISLTAQKFKSTTQFKVNKAIERLELPKLTVTSLSKPIETRSNIPLPIPIPVPLFVCLCKRSRKDLDGVPQGFRNSSGVRLAMNLSH